MSSPQDFVDELQGFKILSLWSKALSSAERASQLKVVRQKIKALKQRLKAEASLIRTEHGGRSQEANIARHNAVAPYQIIDQCLVRLEVVFVEMEQAIQFNKVLPEPPLIGDRIVGGEQFGSYALVTALGSDIFNLRHSLDVFKQVIAPHQEIQAQAETEIDGIAQEIERYEMLIPIAHQMATSPEAQRAFWWEQVAHILTRGGLIAFVFYLCPGSLIYESAGTKSAWLAVACSGMFSALIGLIVRFSVLPRLSLAGYKKSQGKVNQFEQEIQKLRFTFDQAKVRHETAGREIAKITPRIKQIEDQIATLERKERDQLKRIVN